MRDSQLFREPLPENVVASVFANREIHLVLANYGQSAVELETARAYVSGTEPRSDARTRWRLEGRTLVILKAGTYIPGREQISTIEV